jgi:pimeloyl-ACP methyl ester carboxylesterase
MSAAATPARVDPKSGVAYALDGPEDGIPLMIGLPLMASHTAIFGAAAAAVLDAYLGALTDRYRVLRLDYPSIGASADIPPHELTADRVAADWLAVADAAGFDRFAYWGYSWGAAAGLQLAARTDRLSALVIGGWPPLGAPVSSALRATRLKAPDPEPSSMVVLRSKAQYAQWGRYYESLAAGPGEAEIAAQLERTGLPRLLFFGGDGDLVEAGIPVPIASTCRRWRERLEAQGWRVIEFPGQGHGVTMRADLVVPAVRGFLDAALTR